MMLELSQMTDNNTNNLSNIFFYFENFIVN